MDLEQELLEANKICAEFIGWTKIQNSDIAPFGRLVGLNPKTRMSKYGHQKVILPCFCSLDALVPIWEKLEVLDLKFECFMYDSIGWFLDIGANKDTREDDLNQLGYSIQEAALIATAKAIKKFIKKRLT